MRVSLTGIFVPSNNLYNWSRDVATVAPSKLDASKSAFKARLMKPRHATAFSS